MNVRRVTAFAVFSLFLASLFFHVPLPSSTGFQAINSYNASLLPERNIDWVVLTTVNDGFLDFFVNWWAHYQALGLPMVVYVVAEDTIISQKLRLLYNSSLLRVEESHRNVTSPLMSGSKEHNQMMLQRTEHLVRHLRAGENVIFTDIDVIWRKDPRPLLKSSDIDVWFQKEKSKKPCAGFFAIRSNKETTAFAKRWADRNKVIQRRRKGQNSMHDQEVLKYVLKTETALRRTFLPISLFPIGVVYYDFLSEGERDQCVAVHFNWTHDKKKDMQKYGFWIVENQTMVEYRKDIVQHVEEKTD